MGRIPPPPPGASDETWAWYRKTQREAAVLYLICNVGGVATLVVLVVILVLIRQQGPS